MNGRLLSSPSVCFALVVVVLVVFLLVLLLLVVVVVLLLLLLLLLVLPAVLPGTACTHRRGYRCVGRWAAGCGSGTSSRTTTPCLCTLLLCVTVRCCASAVARSPEE